MECHAFLFLPRGVIILHFIPGVPQKSLTFFKPVYLRPLISLRESSVLEMNLWISFFKNTNSKFSRIFVFRDIKGIRYYSRFSGYSWPTSDTSEITNYFEMACIWPKMIIIQVLKLVWIGNTTQIDKNVVSLF